MADKGSPRYYEELLDTVYRSLLSLYIAGIVIVWLAWVFSHHGYGWAWQLVLVCGILLAGGFLVIYFTNLADRLSERYYASLRP